YRRRHSGDPQLARRRGTGGADTERPKLGAAPEAKGARGAMTGIQPELWGDAPHEAVTFYQAAFGATVLPPVGDGDDLVAQLGVGDAAFWVASSAATMGRLSPRAIDGATSRTLLVVDDPESVVRQAVAAGATESSPVGVEHGWRLGRIIDPFGHEWETAVPLRPCPPPSPAPTPAPAPHPRC